MAKREAARNRESISASTPTSAVGAGGDRHATHGARSPQRSRLKARGARRARDVGRQHRAEVSREALRRRGRGSAGQRGAVDTAAARQRQRRPRGQAGERAASTAMSGPFGTAGCRAAEAQERSVGGRRETHARRQSLCAQRRRERQGAVQRSGVAARCHGAGGARTAERRARAKHASQTAAPRRERGGERHGEERSTAGGRRVGKEGRGAPRGR